MQNKSKIRTSHAVALLEVERTLVDASQADFERALKRWLDEVRTTVDAAWAREQAKPARHLTLVPTIRGHIDSPHTHVWEWVATEPGIASPGARCSCGEILPFD